MMHIVCSCGSGITFVENILQSCCALIIPRACSIIIARYFVDCPSVGCHCCSSLKCSKIDTLFSDAILINHNGRVVDNCHSKDIIASCESGTIQQRKEEEKMKKSVRKWYSWRKNPKKEEKFIEYVPMNCGYETLSRKSNWISESYAGVIPTVFSVVDDSRASTALGTACFTP